MNITQWFEKSWQEVNPCPTPGALRVRDISVLHDPKKGQVLQNITFNLDSDKTAALLGPSGCGKTTLLRTIAGFVRPLEGEIWIAGERLVGTGHFVPPEARGIGFVFQDLALFPHLTVAENVAFGLRRWRVQARREQVKKMLKLVDLEGFADVYPSRLSGGQQRRVALARALAPQPRLLLLDEPFSGVELRLRQELIREIRRILLEQGVGGLLVTHHPEEAYRFADVIGVMKKRQLVQWDTPYNLYHKPLTPFVAHFTGLTGWLAAERVGGLIQTPCGTFALPDTWEPELKKGFVLLRPEDILYDESSNLFLEVEEWVFNGADFLCRLRLPDGTIAFSLVPSHRATPNERAIPVRLALKHWIVFSDNSVDPSLLTESSSHPF